MRKDDHQYITYALPDTSEALADLRAFMEEWSIRKEGDATRMIMQAFSRARRGDMSRLQAFIGTGGGQSSLPPPTTASNAPAIPVTPALQDTRPMPPVPPVKRAGMNGHSSNGRPKGNADAVDLDL